MHLGMLATFGIPTGFFRYTDTTSTTVAPSTEIEGHPQPILHEFGLYSFFFLAILPVNTLLFIFTLLYLLDYQKFRRLTSSGKLLSEIFIATAFTFVSLVYALLWTTLYTDYTLLIQLAIPVLTCTISLFGIELALIAKYC